MTDAESHPVRRDSVIAKIYSGFLNAKGAVRQNGSILDPDDGKTHPYSLSAFTMELGAARRNSRSARIPVFWRRTLNRIYRGFVADGVLKNPGDLQVLEIGPGDGTLAAMLAPAGYDILGIDFMAAFAAHAARRHARLGGRLRFEQGDATNLVRVPGKSKHVVMINEGLGNLPLFTAQAEAKSRQERRPVHPVFDEFARVLRPGGCLVIHDELPESEHTTQIAGYLHYSIADRLKALRNAGLDVVSARRLRIHLRGTPYTHTIIARKPGRPARMGKQ